jgi:Aldehyde dehydrogenase family
MRTSKYSEEQIIGFLRQAEAGLPIKALGAPYFGYLTGQICHSLTRIIVPRAKHAAMVDAPVAAARGMAMGDPLDVATTMGPLAANSRQARVKSVTALQPPRLPCAWICAISALDVRRSCLGRWAPAVRSRTSCRILIGRTG